MITCPNCNHQNPDGALQCEACYTPLPALATCPNCQASVQADASFCGQCGYDLRESSGSESTATASSPAGEPVAEPVSESSGESAGEPTGEFSAESAGESFSEFSQSVNFDESISFGGLAASTGSGLESAASSTTSSTASIPTATKIQMPGASLPKASLRHVQTQTSIAIPGQLSIVRIGKPNNHTPPDIDVSGFPESEIVSRVHANLLVEDTVYYLEDIGSSNGTYINGLPLPAGNRHRLNAGDRIAFGKGDKVSFIFGLATD